MDEETDGIAFTRYNLSVTNRASYPDSMFADAPDLPACGLNTDSARTWVDIQDGDGNYLYGFCDLDGADSMGNLWFALHRGTTHQRPARSRCLRRLRCRARSLLERVREDEQVLGLRRSPGRCVPRRASRNARSTMCGRTCSCH